MDNDDPFIRGVMGGALAYRASRMVEKSIAFQQRRAALQGNDDTREEENSPVISARRSGTDRSKEEVKVTDLPRETLSKIFEMSGDFLAIERFANLSTEAYNAVKDWKCSHSGSSIFVKRSGTVHLFDIKAWICGHCGGKFQSEYGEVGELRPFKLKQLFSEYMTCGKKECLTCVEKHPKNCRSCDVSSWGHQCPACQGRINTCDICHLTYCDRHEQKCDKCGMQTCGRQNEFGASTCNYCDVTLCYLCAHHPPPRGSTHDPDVWDNSMWDCWCCGLWSCNANGGGNTNCPEFVFNGDDHWCLNCDEDDEEEEDEEENV